MHTGPSLGLLCDVLLNEQWAGPEGKFWVVYWSGKRYGGFKYFGMLTRFVAAHPGAVAKEFSKSGDDAADELLSRNQDNGVAVEFGFTGS